MKMIGERLKELRESAGYSPAEFALMFGISRSSVYRYEGRNVKESREIPISLAIDISKKFGISLDWMAGNSDIKYINQSESELTKIYNGLPESAQGELFNFAVYLQDREGGADSE